MGGLGGGEIGVAAGELVDDPLHAAQSVRRIGFELPHQRVDGGAEVAQPAPDRSR